MKNININEFLFDLTKGVEPFIYTERIKRNDNLIENFTLWDFQISDLSDLYIKIIDREKLSISIKILTGENKNEVCELVTSLDTISHFLEEKIIEKERDLNQKFYKLNMDHDYYLGNLNKVLKNEKCDWNPELVIDSQGDYRIIMRQLLENGTTLSHMLIPFNIDKNLTDELAMIDFKVVFSIPSGEGCVAENYVPIILAKDLEIYPILEKIGYTKNIEKDKTLENFANLVLKNSNDEKLISIVNFHLLNNSLENKEKIKKERKPKI